MSDTVQRSRPDPDLCSFCGGRRPGELRVISKQRRIQICVDCAQRCLQTAAEGRAKTTATVAETVAPAMPRERATRRLMLQRLGARRFVLTVCLPRNDPRLALAALAGGADALLMHLNVEGTEAGAPFGGLRDERPGVAAVMEAAVGVPVGVVPGRQRMASPDDILALDALALDFFSVAAEWMPAWLLALEGIEMSAMIGLGPRTTPEQTQDLLDSPAPGGHLDMVEAAVIPPEGQGQALSALDLATYSRLAQLASPKPLLVPTQRAIRPSEVRLLAEAGARGLLVTPGIMPGKDPDSVRRATEAYAAVIQSL